MRLPLPSPRPAAQLIGAVQALAEEVVGALPRAMALLTGAEALLVRVDELIDRIEETRASADRVIVRTAGTVGSIEPTIERAQRLLDSMAPPLERLQPTLDLLARTTSAEEVQAVVRLVDELPMLVDRLTSDILPIVENMRTVAPDIHDMLDTLQELNQMMAKIPGMGRIRQRVEDKQSDTGGAS